MLVMPPTIAPTRKSNDLVIWNDSGLTKALTIANSPPAKPANAGTDAQMRRGARAGKVDAERFRDQAVVAHGAAARRPVSPRVSRRMTSTAKRDAGEADEIEKSVLVARKPAGRGRASSC